MYDHKSLSEIRSEELYVNEALLSYNNIDFSNIQLPTNSLLLVKIAPYFNFRQVHFISINLTCGNLKS